MFYFLFLLIESIIIEEKGKGGSGLSSHAHMAIVVGSQYTHISVINALSIGDSLAAAVLCIKRGHFTSLLYLLPLTTNFTKPFDED